MTSSVKDLIPEGFKSKPYTVKPSFKNSSAAANPIPLLAPVIKTFQPLLNSFNFSYLFYFYAIRYSMSNRDKYY